MQQISCEHSANKPQTFALKKEKNIGFYGPFKNIALISSRSYIRGGPTPEYPEKKHLTYRCRTWHLAYAHGILIECKMAEAETGFKAVVKIH